MITSHGQGPRKRLRRPLQRPQLRLGILICKSYQITPRLNSQHQRLHSSLYHHSSGSNYVSLRSLSTVNPLAPLCNRSKVRDRIFSRVWVPQSLHHSQPRHIQPVIRAAQPNYRARHHLSIQISQGANQELPPPRHPSILPRAKRIRVRRRRLMVLPRTAMCQKHRRLNLGPARRHRPHRQARLNEAHHQKLRVERTNR